MPALGPRAHDPGCAFCRVIGGVAAGHVVFEDDVALAFLDHRPLFPGHTLVVPRAHVPTLVDLPPDLVGPLFVTVRHLARAVEIGLGAEGSFVAVNNRISQSVPHLHVHVVPRRSRDGLRGFFWPRGRYRDAAEMREVQERLRAALGALGPPPR
jgi:histidine triad (HIT) family protein